MTIRQTLDRAIKQLDTAGISGGRLDAQLLLAHVLGQSRSWLLAHDTDDLTPEQITKFDYVVAQRTRHIPVVHLTGNREFFGLNFEITPDVLTPRAETEQMVEWAVKYAPKNSRLLDIGTGSGAIAIAIASRRPDLTITATEITDVALEVAKRNAKKHQVSLRLLKSDLWQNVTGAFETVVTNLPYLRDDADLMPEVKREPAVALFGGADGLDLYRRFLTDLPSHLAPGGYLFTECDPWQQNDLITEAAHANLTPIEQGYFILGFRRQV